MRGKVAMFCCAVGAHRITPAYAGKRKRHRSGCIVLKDHPRVCGEKVRYAINIENKMGSPPRMRGKACVKPCCLSCVGITPAYAGKRTICKDVTKTRQDHPRVCGEKLNGNAKGQAATGSPPRMRGKEVRGQDVADARRITPAYAGKRDYRMKPNRVSGDHPRVCGEKYASILVFSGCSGITPAYAGKSLIHISS